MNIFSIRNHKIIWLATFGVAVFLVIFSLLGGETMIKKASRYTTEKSLESIGIDSDFRDILLGR